MKRQDLKIFLLITLVAILAISFGYSAVKKPEVTAKADKTQIHVGDRINLDVTCSGAKGLEVSFPEKPENLGEFSFIGSKPIKGGRAYVMSIYTTGTHVVPPVEVKYRPNDGTQWESAQSPQIPVEVTSLLTGEDVDIRDLKALAVLGGTLPGIMVVLIILSLLAIAGTIFYNKFKKRAELLAAGAKSPYEIAYESLMKLKYEDLPGKGLIKEYYTALSDIIRQYLENRFSFRAPEMTTEEFLGSIKEAAELEDKHKKLLKEFLFHCDMVKFAKYGPTPLEMLDVFKSAENLVDQTRVVEEEAIQV